MNWRPFVFYTGSVCWYSRIRLCSHHHGIPRIMSFLDVLSNKNKWIFLRHRRKEKNVYIINSSEVFFGSVTNRYFCDYLIYAFLVGSNTSTTTTVQNTNWSWCQLSLTAWRTGGCRVDNLRCHQWRQAGITIWCYRGGINTPWSLESRITS